MRIAIRRYRYLIAACTLAVVAVAGLGAFGIAQANADDAVEVPEQAIEQPSDANADEVRLAAEDVPAEDAAAPADAAELPEQAAGDQSADADEPRLVADEPSESETPASAAAAGQVEEAAPGTRLEEADEDVEDGSLNTDEVEEMWVEEPHAAAAV